MSTAQHTAPTILDLPIGLADTGHRKEFDSLGEVMVPAGRSVLGRPNAALAGAFRYRP